MKTIVRLFSSFLMQNGLGWALAVVNLSALYFFLWYLEGGLHNPTATGCVDGKFTLISTFRYGRGEILSGLSDAAMIFVVMLNTPALFLSNFAADVFFAGKQECISNLSFGWEYSLFYKTRIGLNVLFVVFQWLAIGTILKKLFKLVKDS